MKMIIRHHGINANLPGHAPGDIFREAIRPDYKCKFIDATTVGADPCVRPITFTLCFRADTEVCPYGGSVIRAGKYTGRKHPHSSSGGAYADNHHI